MLVGAKPTGVGVNNLIYFIMTYQILQNGEIAQTE